MFNGHSEVVAYLRSVGGSIFSGEMAYRLCMLACNDDLDGMKALVEVGVDPNLPDYDLRTALHLASCMESVMVRFVSPSCAHLSFPRHGFRRR
jgi:ankyrin repeat protein